MTEKQKWERKLKRETARLYLLAALFTTLVFAVLMTAVVIAAIYGQKHDVFTITMPELRNFVKTMSIVMLSCFTAPILTIGVILYTGSKPD